MKLLKSLFFIGILSFSASNYAQFTDQINSNRPGNSAGAFSVGKKVFQLEGGLNYINESHSIANYDASGFGLDFAARYGVWKEQLEVTLDAQFQMDKYSSGTFETNRSGLRQTTLGAKYLVYDPFKKGEEKPNIHSWKANYKFKWKQFIPAVAVYVGANYTMENDFSIPGESVLSPKAAVIAQNHFGTKWVLVTNLIADKIGSVASNYSYILTLTYGINEKWSAMLENRGIKGDYYSDGIFTLGATHLLKDNLQVDVSINKSIKDTPSIFYGGIGCSWRFDKKHKDPKIEDGKEVKEEKKTKSKSGQLSEEELQKAAEKAEKKRKKNKDSEEEETDKPVEEKKKRLDDFEEGKE
ncbi:MAG: transporter [Bacteroidota bacterium]